MGRKRRNTGLFHKINPFMTSAKFLDVLTPSPILSHFHATFLVSLPHFVVSSTLYPLQCGRHKWMPPASLSSLPSAPNETLAPASSLAPALSALCSPGRPLTVAPPAPSLFQAAAVTAGTKPFRPTERWNRVRKSLNQTITQPMTHLSLLHIYLWANN